MTECGKLSDFSIFVINIKLKYLHLADLSPHIPFVIFVVSGVRYEGIP